MIKMAKISISKADDTGDYYTTDIQCETWQFSNAHIGGDRSALDPIQSGLEKYWRQILSPKNSRRYGRGHGFGRSFSHLVMINGCPVLLTREGIRYEVNGKSYNLANISAALARLTFKSCFENEPAKLLSALYSTLQLPENVKYCLENKLPYHWYELLEGEEPIKVRLNCQQIGDNEIAVEVSDGVWGTMTVKQLDVFCNYYKNEKNRGSWVDTSPTELYYKTVGKMPTESELEVMKAFLQQNRTSDLVERRAIQLVNELLEQYPDRLTAEWEGDVLTNIIVRGKDYDWKLTNNKYKSEIQMVSTYVWQPVPVRTAIGVDDEDNTIYEDKLSDPDWQGPICIDNMATGSSLGDQFAARALALLNDRFTVTIVNTIKRYLKANANEYRIDDNENM